MAKIAKPMTRIVAIGNLVSYEYKTEPVAIGKGEIDTGKGNKIRFTIWDNNKPDAKNPHTKAADFQSMFKEGDKIFLTGQDNRTYSEEKDVHYENIQLWDYRAAESDEDPRLVFVYIGDVQDLTGDSFNLSYVDYKDNETIFPIQLGKAKMVPDALENGCRIKVKGEIFSGLKMDYFGDGEYVTERNGVIIEVINTAAEIEEDKKETEEAAQQDSAMWD